MWSNPGHGAGITLAHSPAQKQASPLSTSDKPPSSILAGSDQSRLLALLSSEAQGTVGSCREPLYRAENPSPIPWEMLLTALILLQKHMSVQPRPPAGMWHY